ncbi:MAG: dimethyl sulfoxide reductase anchor subunit [Dehalococcoidia bacterium]|nr:dimethyl sulfoxide reductase anchor subunit [Dehalococcoidia bacterium]
MSHTAYVIFTVFSQMAVGALIAMVIADFLAKGKEEAKFFETGAWVSVPVAVIGLIAMLSHEARPIQAMMTMNANLATSWLSRESLVLTVFVVLAVIYTVLWVCEQEYGSLKGIPVIPKIAKIFMPLRKVVGIISAAVGIVFLGVSAKAYMLMGLPASNQSTTPLFFFITTLLVGVTAVAAVLSVKYVVKKEAVKPFTSLLWATWGIALVMAIVLLFTLFANISALQQAGIGVSEGTRLAQAETLENMLHGDYTTLFYARVIIGVVLTLVCLAALILPLKKKDISKASALTFAVFVCVLIGELLGRAVFFGANVPLGEVMPYVLSSIV